MQEKKIKTIAESVFIDKLKKGEFKNPKIKKMKVSSGKDKIKVDYLMEVVEIIPMWSCKIEP